MTNNRAILVVDLAFGDCGKGTIIDFLTRSHNAHAVVRFNGGPQAGHNVVTPDGRHHTFSQFGSGTFIPGVHTVLSRFMLIEPYALFNETAHLAQLGVGDALNRLMIDRRCLVITPAQQAANRLRELARGDRAHGTCGLGIGETMQDKLDQTDRTLRAGDLADRGKVIRILRAVREMKAEQLHAEIATLASHPKARFAAETLLDDSWIEVAANNCLELTRHATIADEKLIHAAIGSPGVVLFEGAQGVLLDETFAFHPHTTWSKTTFANADVLLNEAGYSDQRTRLGVLRAYFTRHGAGPFVTEDPSLRERLPEPHNVDTGWQGNFRAGPFDAVAARYALAACGRIDALAITHLDRLRQLPSHVCTAYVDDQTNGAIDTTDDFFVRANGTIVDINPTPPRTLETSELRTQAVAACRPIYTPIQNDREDAFLEFLSSELRAPIAIVSSGPTANEKRRRGSAFV